MYQSTPRVYKNIPASHFGWVLALWAAVQFFFYVRFGIITEHESEAYLTLRDDWLKGNFNQMPHLFLYSGYVAVLVGVKWLGLPQNATYIIQLFLGALSLMAFMKMVGRLTQHWLTPVFSGTLLATCYLYQIWSVMLYTEAIFLPLLVLTLYCLVHYELGLNFKIGFWLLLIISLSFRPNAYFIIPVAAYYFVQHKSPKLWIKLCVLAIPFFVFNYIASWVATKGAYYYLFRPNIDADIICGIPSPYLKQFIKKPWQPGTGLLEYFWQNPSYTLRLIPARIFRNLWMTRPYYTPANNLIIGLSLIGYYFLALVGTATAIKHKAEPIGWILLGVAVFTLPAVFMCAEWNNRLIAPIFPFLFLLVALGIDYLLRLLPKQNRPNKIPDMETFD